ncbi:Mtf2-like C-terminal domain-containing protein [Madurella fahalii]|uniref:Mtf2-like C-terminal domain-containing protein n=1 Tax=Madurella fahalii TaxID=1157608 RepID=A0ABQ0GH55_9PEZI
MSTTLMPFLYQTRTLQRLSRAGLSTPAFRALLHSKPRGKVPRTPSGRGRVPPWTESIPFELPEGYEDPREEKRSKSKRAERDSSWSTITPAEKHTFSRIFEEIAERNKLRAPTASSPLSDDLTTMMSDEYSETAAPASNEDASTSDDLDAFDDGFDGSDDFGDFKATTEESDPTSIRDTINIIVEDAAAVQTSSRRNLEKPFDRLHPLEQASGAKEWEKAMLRFPPSLRKAARMALNVIESDKQAEKLTPPPDRDMSDEQRLAAQIDLVLDPLAKSVQNEALRRRERNRVETRMREAKTDFELWDVLEEEVFPMIEKLDIASGEQKAPGKRKRNRKRNKQDGAPDKQDGASPDASISKDKLPMHIYGPLYPVYLLRAVHLLDTQFARSSPLALSILPRVKELGAASYVLGVSTPFYNEVARILWSRYGDPTAVFDLLEEMRAAGLYCDEGTRAIVHSIHMYFQGVYGGLRGPFLRELMSFPEYEFAVLPRVRHWQKTIAKHIMQRRRDMRH